MGKGTALAVRMDRVDALDFLAWSIGSSLRNKREARRMTQADVARLAKMRPEVLNRLEKGHGNPTVRTVQRVLMAMGYKG